MNKSMFSMKHCASGGAAQRIVHSLISKTPSAHAGSRPLFPGFTVQESMVIRGLFSTTYVLVANHVLRFMGEPRVSLPTLVLAKVAFCPPSCLILLSMVPQRL